MKRYLSYLVCWLIMSTVSAQAAQVVIAPFGGGTFTRANTGAWSLKFKNLTTGVTNAASSGVQNTLVGGSGNWSLLTGTLGTQTINYGATSAPHRLELYPSQTSTVPFCVWFSQESGSPAKEKLFPDTDPAYAGGYVAADGTKYNDLGQPRSYSHDFIAEGPLPLEGPYRTWTVYAQRGGVTFATQSQTVNAGASHTFTFGPFNEDFQIIGAYTTAPLDGDMDGINDSEDPFPSDPENDGWGDRALDDDDADGIANWDDEYPNDATKGTAGSTAGQTSGSSGVGPDGAAPAKFTFTVELDNSTGTKTETFVVAVVSKATGEIIARYEVAVFAGLKDTLVVKADEAFTVDVSRKMDGPEGGTTYEPVVKNGESIENTNGEIKGDGVTANKNSSYEGVSEGPEGLPASELEGLKNVTDQLKLLRDDVKATSAETNSILTGVGTAGPAIDTGEDLKNEASGIMEEVGKIGTNLTGLVASLGIGNYAVGAANLNFSIPLPSGTVTVDVEKYAAFFTIVRLACLGLLSLAFAHRMIRVGRSAFSG